MSDEHSREAMKAARKASLLEQVAAAFDRDMAEAERLAAKYPDLFTIAPSRNSPPAPDPISPLTIANLADHYRTDKRSPYPTLRPSTRAHYDYAIKRLIKVCGDVQVADLAKPKIQG